MEYTENLQIFDDHNSATFNLGERLHSFTAFTLVENFEKFSCRRIKMQFPRACRSIEVAGILLHIALEATIETIHYATSLNQGNIRKSPADSASAHVKDQDRIFIRRFLHGEFPTKILPACREVQETAVRIRNIFGRRSLDIDIQGARLVCAGSHAENVSDAIAKR